MQRYLTELDDKGYIKRLPQRHKSSAAGSNVGQFSLAPIRLTAKALQLLGLQDVVHRQTSIKLIDVRIQKERPTEAQSSSKNSIPEGSPEQKPEGSPELQAGKTACRVDPATRLPMDLLPLLDMGLSNFAIFRLMRLAKEAGKRLSDVFGYRGERMRQLGLHGRAAFAYLADLVAQDIDFAWLRGQQQADQVEIDLDQRAQEILDSLDDRFEGFAFHKHGTMVGIFRAPKCDQDCAWIETGNGVAPINLAAARWMAKNPGAYKFRPWAGATEWAA